ncbi:hypothetical protein HGP16_23160 [Rhizobium sp. P40RR-XXII]|uniref:hypothetical protein n=1 Tax=unclassified Rhizobium TaxID=2613769 RepID=UPI0014564E63|nr:MULTISPECIES: hypothetical protein [unclassified Rhizobium]NLR85779.1 hypothetical protein [Rhizobium sp. P28RR-XV]NLS19441.1 hypothetical protein [Rhizobium sp. P40RR-XXII]
MAQKHVRAVIAAQLIRWPLQQRLQRGPQVVVTNALNRGAMTQKRMGKQSVAASAACPILHFSGC